MKAITERNILRDLREGKENFEDLWRNEAIREVMQESAEIKHWLRNQMREDIRKGGQPDFTNPLRYEVAISDFEIYKSSRQRLWNPTPQATSEGQPADAPDDINTFEGYTRMKREGRLPWTTE